MIRGLLVSILLLITMGMAHGAINQRDRSYPPLYTGVNIGVSTVQPNTKPVHHNYKRTHHLRRTRPRHPTVPVLPKDSGNLVTVPTAAGVTITVARTLANQFQGFVADLVKLGYTPKHIGCWAPAGTHVVNSNHYHGGACDFDQTGWGRTNSQMYHVSSLAAKWGLRDGCSFRRPDCGHIDDGTNIHWKHPGNLIAKYITYQTSPAPEQQQPRVLDNFESSN